MTSKDEHPLDLLPWYVNGSLGAEEKQQIEAHLASCESCQRERDLLALIQTEVKKDSQSPGELHKMRFMREIKQDQQSQATQTRPWWYKVTAVAAALVIVVQTGIILDRPGGGDGPGIQPLGKATAEYSVEFQPNASMSAVNQFLKSVGGRIVNGPIETSDGKIFYEIDLDAIDANSNAQLRQQWETKLKSHTNTIISVNPIDGD